MSERLHVEGVMLSAAAEGEFEGVKVERFLRDTAGQSKKVS